MHSNELFPFFKFWTNKASGCLQLPNQILVELLVRPNGKQQIKKLQSPHLAGSLINGAEFQTLKFKV